MKSGYTQMSKTVAQRIIEAAPRLLPLIGALAVVAGIIGLTLFQNTLSQSNLDIRRQASVNSGSVEITSELTSLEIVDPARPTRKSVTFYIDTNNTSIDAVAAYFTIKDTTGSLIHLDVRSWPDGLHPVKSTLLKQGDTYVGGLEFITTNPSSPYRNNSKVPLFTLQFIPTLEGSVEITFDRSKSVALSTDGVQVDVLTHIQDVSFDTSIPTTQTVQNDLVFAPYQSGQNQVITFFKRNTNTVVERTSLEENTEYDLELLYAVDNLAPAPDPAETDPVVIETTLNGKKILTQLDYAQLTRSTTPTKRSLKTSFVARKSNTLTQKIDPENDIAEVDETNNIVTRTFSAKEEVVENGTGGVSACVQPTDIEIDEASCGGEGVLYVELDWERPAGAKEFELQLSRDSDFDNIQKRIFTRSSDWKTNSSIDDRVWFARVRVSESEESCTLPGTWSVVTFDIDCDDPDYSDDDVVQCNESCDSNNDCPVNHGCFATESGNRCRLAHNPTSASCQPLASYGDNTRSCNQSCYESSDCAGTLTCWYNTCRAPENLRSPICSTTTTTTPVAQCNEACGSNADCGVNQRCYNNACRLATNLASPICAPANDGETKGGTKGETGADTTGGTGTTGTATTSAQPNTPVATTSATVTLPSPKPSYKPIESIPETETAQEETSSFVRWLKGIFGAGSSTSESATEQTQGVDGEQSQEAASPMLAMILLVLGASILAILLLVTIVRAITGSRPRGVVSVAPSNTPSGSGSSGSSSSGSSATAATPREKLAQLSSQTPAQRTTPVVATTPSTPPRQPVNAVVSRTQPVIAPRTPSEPAKPQPVRPVQPASQPQPVRPTRPAQTQTPPPAAKPQSPQPSDKDRQAAAARKTQELRSVKQPLPQKSQDSRSDKPASDKPTLEELKQRAIRSVSEKSAQKQSQAQSSAQQSDSSGMLDRVKQRGIKPPSGNKNSN